MYVSQLPGYIQKFGCNYIKAFTLLSAQLAKFGYSFFASFCFMSELTKISVMFGKKVNFLH
jgi:hypothetical protein